MADGIGVTLARAREAAGLTIAQLGQQTNIPSGFIKTLEQGYLSAPGGEDADRTSFTPGVIRELAKAVGLDPEPLVQEYKESGGGRRLKHAPSAEELRSMPDLQDPPDAPEEFAEPALRPVWTINQVVAYNLQAARRAQQWPQDYLAHQLVKYTNRPWSNATVSAAERSWESGRTRRFDANELLALSRVFNLPVAYFFLPPDHADESFAYIAGTPGGPDEYKEGSYASLRPQDLLDAIAPLSTSSEYADRLKATQDRLGGAYRQRDDIPEGLDPEEELAIVEVQLKYARGWLSDIVTIEAEAQDRIASLTARTEALRGRIKRREKLVDSIQKGGREQTEEGLILLLRQSNKDFMLTYGWPPLIGHDLETELDVIVEIWPDLEEICDEVIDHFKMLEKWWLEEGGRELHEDNLRKMMDERKRERKGRRREVAAEEESAPEPPSLPAEGGAQ